jgi:hypothetical protein
MLMASQKNSSDKRMMNSGLANPSQGGFGPREPVVLQFAIHPPFYKLLDRVYCGLTKTPPTKLHLSHKDQIKRHADAQHGKQQRQDHRARGNLPRNPLP